MEANNLRDRHALSAGGGVNKALLKQNQYTVSLLNEGMRTKLLTSQEAYNVQSRLMLVLQDLIRRYTQGESSSVSSETAESILTSVMYATDAYLQSFEHPERAITYLKTVDASQIYEKGVELVSRLFEETKLLYKDVKKHKLDVPVDAYNMTIDESLPVFMKKYGVIFEAHNTMASIDYPLAIDDMRLQGVFYIKQYLERLQMETQFVSLFPHQDLLELLVNFGRVCRFDYRIELFNMFELMMNNAIFSILSGGDARQVSISANQFARLSQMFEGLDDARLGELVAEAVKRLQRDLSIADPKLIRYMQLCEADLVQRIGNASRHDSLSTVIITAKEEQAKSIVISLNGADRMSDVQLRKLLRSIEDCETKEAKAKLIKDKFHSLHDYLDMLESDCLYGDEYEALFAVFGDMELAILAKIVFYEELRGESGSFASIVRRKREAEPEWQMHYLDYVKGLGKERLAAIGAYVDNIDYEDIKFY